MSNLVPVLAFLSTRPKAHFSAARSDASIVSQMKHLTALVARVRAIAANIRCKANVACGWAHHTDPMTKPFAYSTEASLL